jgi:hypothetical protein
MQFGQQRAELLQVFESLNILAAKHFRRLDHNPTPSNWPTKNQYKPGRKSRAEQACNLSNTHPNLK